jgi:hypothetical protein
MVIPQKKTTPREPCQGTVTVQPLWLFDPKYFHGAPGDQFARHPLRPAVRRRQENRREYLDPEGETGRSTRRCGWKEAHQRLARLFPHQIDHGDAVYTRDGAKRRTRLLGRIFALEIHFGVLL